MLAKTQDEEQVIARVAALDIGKAELVCCVRVPDEDRPGRRLQEVETYPTMTRPLLSLADRLRCLLYPSWIFRSFAMAHPETIWALLEMMVQRVRDAEAR